MNLQSGFIFTPVGEVSDAFTEMTEVSSSGFNVLLRAKRNGQWWLLKALQPSLRQDSTYLLLQQKEYDILSRLDHPGIMGGGEIGSCGRLRQMYHNGMDRWCDA